MQDFFVIPSPRRGRVLNKKTATIHPKTSFLLNVCCLCCDPCRIQTCNPHIRSVVLYSVELMDPGAVSRQTGEAASTQKGLQRAFRYVLFQKKRGLSLLLATSVNWFSRVLVKREAVRTRLELATYGVTGRYSNQLNYRTR